MTDRNKHWWHPSVRLWNTLSNLSYLVVGAILVVMLDFPPAWTFAGLLTILGVGSGVYHWFGTPATRYYDWFGMFVVIFGLAAFAADPNGPMIHWWMVAISALSATVLVYVKNQVGREPVLGIGMFLVSTPVLGSGHPEAVMFGLLSLVLFGAGLLLQRADNRIGHKGHGWWHVLTALGFMTMFCAITLMRG